MGIDARQMVEFVVCHYCQTAEAIQSDHVIPKSMGGSDARWNRVPTCWPCNRAKSGEWPTCECDHCTAAIDRFTRNPDWIDHARTTLGVRFQRSYDSRVNAIAQIERAEERMISINALVDFLNAKEDAA